MKCVCHYKRELNTLFLKAVRKKKEITKSNETPLDSFIQLPNFPEEDIGVLTSRWAPKAKGMNIKSAVNFHSDLDLESSTASGSESFIVCVMEQETDHELRL